MSWKNKEDLPTINTGDHQPIIKPVSHEDLNPSYVQQSSLLVCGAVLKMLENPQ